MSLCSRFPVSPVSARGEAIREVCRGIHFHVPIAHRRFSSKFAIAFYQGHVCLWKLSPPPPLCPSPSYPSPTLSPPHSTLSALSPSPPFCVRDWYTYFSAPQRLLGTSVVSHTWKESKGGKSTWLEVQLIPANAPGHACCPQVNT